MVINLFGSNEGMALVTGPDDVPDPEERARYFPRAPLFSPPYGSGRATNIEARLIPPQGGEAIIENGIAGELQIKGPTLFEGYFGAPEQTAAAFTEDGYFKTGDLFEIAQTGKGRFLRFVGRSKDIIIRGGQNISPAELDSLIEAHPNVREVSCAAYPDERLGERICAIVALKPGETLSLEELCAFLKTADIATYKLPEKLRVMDALPRNPLGKVLRRDLGPIAAS
jgi:acyl-CoA synthetase (AMP-forming)/AMP-acid ligase II